MAAPQTPTHAPLSFAKYAPFNLDVANVNITEEYQTSSQPPHVEGLFHTPPAEGVRIWVRDRIHPIGGNRTLAVVIKDASVVATPQTPSGGTYTHESGTRYDARLEIEMRIYGETQAMSEASIDVVATRSDTLPASASAADREALYDRMTRALMDVANGELEKNFYRYFGNYLRYD